MPSQLVHPRVKLLSESFQPAQLSPKSNNKRRAIELLEHPAAEAPKKRKYNRRTEEQKEQDRLKPKRKYVRRTQDIFRDAVPVIIAPGEVTVNQKSKSKRKCTLDLKSMAPCFCGEQKPAEDMISCSGLWCPKADMWMHHSCAKVTAEEVEYRQRMWLNWYCVDCVEKRLVKK